MAKSPKSPGAAASKPATPKSAAKAPAAPVVEAPAVVAPAAPVSAPLAALPPLPPPPPLRAVRCAFSPSACAGGLRERGAGAPPPGFRARSRRALPATPPPRSSHPVASLALVTVESCSGGCSRLSGAGRRRRGRVPGATNRQTRATPSRSLRACAARVPASPSIVAPPSLYFLRSAACCACGACAALTAESAVCSARVSITRTRPLTAAPPFHVLLCRRQLRSPRRLPRR